MVSATGGDHKEVRLEIKMRGAKSEEPKTSRFAPLPPGEDRGERFRPGETAGARAGKFAAFHNGFEQAELGLGKVADSSYGEGPMASMS